jgi:hypothetical protein
MSVHSSTHSAQMKTVGPAMSLRTSFWLLPQNEQKSVFFESLSPNLLISEPRKTGATPQYKPGVARSLSQRAAAALAFDGIIHKAKVPPRQRDLIAAPHGARYRTWPFRTSENKVDTEKAVASCPTEQQNSFIPSSSITYNAIYRRALAAEGASMLKLRLRLQSASGAYLRR